METRHRPVFSDGGNRFWRVDLDGTIRFEEEPACRVPERIANAVAAHEHSGRHADCILCQRKRLDELADGLMRVDLPKANARRMLDEYARLARALDVSWCWQAMAWEQLLDAEDLRQTQEGARV